MKCVRDGGKGNCTDEVRDISEGGLCLVQSQAHELIGKSDFVKVFVPIPQHDTDRDALCILVGQVTWRKDDRAGVAFVAPSKENLDTIRAFIDARLALSVEV